jgi:hypothetical protein
MTVSPETFAEIQALEYRYARLLDDDRLEEWPELFTERGVYKVIPRENRGRDPELPVLFCDSRAMMVDRVRSLRQANIYNLHYPRHVVTNIEVLAAMSPQCTPCIRPIWKVRRGCSASGNISTRSALPATRLDSARRSWCATPSAFPTCWRSRCSR